MGRTIVRPVAPQRNRKSRDRMVMALFGIVLVFAIVGVVSAGVFVANHVNANGSATPAGTRGGNQPVTGSSQSVDDVARAQAQATALVKAANDASGAIIKTANSKAHKRASAIIAAARKQAGAAPTSVPVGLPSTSPSTGSALGTTAGVLPYATSLPSTNSSTTGSPGTVPNLAGLPASWKVIGYGASFGAGPGSAGSISVINRSATAFSGLATVRYANGQVASAPFSGLGPGQSAALPLNGPRYPGGKYTISLTNLK